MAWRKSITGCKSEWQGEDANLENKPYGEKLPSIIYVFFALKMGFLQVFFYSRDW